MSGTNLSVADLLSVALIEVCSRESSVSGGAEAPAPRRALAKAEARIRKARSVADSGAPDVSIPPELVRRPE